MDDEDEVLAEDVDVRELEVHKTAIRGIADHSNKQGKTSKPIENSTSDKASAKTPIKTSPTKKAAVKKGTPAKQKTSKDNFRVKKSSGDKLKKNLSDGDKSKKESLDDKPKVAPRTTTFKSSNPKQVPKHLAMQQETTHLYIANQKLQQSENSDESTSPNSYQIFRAPQLIHPLLMKSLVKAIDTTIKPFGEAIDLINHPSKQPTSPKKSNPKESTLSN